MNSFPLLPKKQPNPLRSPSQKREFHKLLKEAYLALADDLVEEEGASRNGLQTALAGHFLSRPQPQNPAGMP